MTTKDRIRKVEAMVISHRDFGEADRIVKLFTREEGKLNAIAKGARRMRSRKAAHLEPFTHAALILAVGRSFWIVTQADTISDFPSIRANLQKTGQASYILELADLLSTEFQVDRGMYRLILSMIQKLENGANDFNLILHYELRILDLAGFRPELFNCVICRSEILAEDQYFSAKQGGVICPRCSSMSNEKIISADMETLRYLRHFQRSPYRKIEETNVPKTIKQTLRHMVDLYIASVTERKLNSTGFLSHINHIQPINNESADIS